MSFASGLVAFFAAIFVIILVHELGHLLAAKWTRMPASVFSIGFGPRLWGFRLGETEYRLSAIPLGGYVRIDPMERTVLGPHGPMSEFDTYPLRDRALVISAGVVMNLLLALGIYMGMALAWGTEAEEPLRVARVEADRLPAGAEAWASLPRDARVVRVDGEPVERVQDLMLAIAGAHPPASTVELAGGGTLRLPVPEGDEEKLALVRALVPATAPVVGEIVRGAPADRAGFRAWDRVVSADGVPVHSWQGWRTLVRERPERSFPVTVLRDGKEVALTLVPAEGPDGAGAAGLGRGVVRAEVGLAGAAAWAGGRFGETLDLIRESWGILLSGALSPRQVSGPVTVAETSVRVFHNGWEPFLAFVAFLSVNIAVVNFLPIPALDGGYFALLALEAVRRRPLAPPLQAYLGRVGVIWLCLVMAGTVVNDLLRLSGR